MSFKERAKATAETVEGKIQEAIGNVTGDIDTQVEGQAKQAEAELRQIKEDEKDKAKNENIDIVSDD
jgi:uncharacterized protein YjbJ (UPF0337 family)